MSEHTLDGLIAKVKSEAIEASEKEAKLIIDKAREQAQRIITEANTEKDTLIENAKTEAEALIEKGKIALNQASRDAEIAIKSDLQKLFKIVLEGEVKDHFSADLYANVISKVIDSLGSNVSIALPIDLEDELLNSIRKKVADSKLTPDIIKKEGLLSGLSVIKKDEGWSYDITAEEVSDLLSQHLNKKWVQLLKTD